MSDLFDQTKEFVGRGVATQRAVDKLCRKSDPETSRGAAEKMVKSGALSRQEEQVLAAIQLRLSFKPYTWKDNFTAKELATTSVINYYTIQRRLSGLHNKDKIERTGEKRDGCMVWRLKGK